MDVMSRQIAYMIATMMLLVAAPSRACMPPTIPFESGSARLGADSLAYLDQVALGFRNTPRARVRLMAQTRRSGPADANVRLSLLRGTAVKVALIRRGIPAGAIEIDARGEAGTVTDAGTNDTKDLVLIEVLSAPSTCS